jgi:hypothetical protein
MSKALGGNKSIDLFWLWIFEKGMDKSEATA